MVCIVIQWIVCFLLVLPSFIWRDVFIILYESDYFCGVQYEIATHFWYLASSIYALPLVYIGIIYVRLIYFLSHQSLQLSQTHQRRRAQRDYLIIRRILFTMVVLALAGLPNLGLGLLSQIKPNLSGDYYMYRIEWMVPSVTILIISIGFVFITPQLKTVIVSRLRRENQVVPEENTRS